MGDVTDDVKFENWLLYGHHQPDNIYEPAKRLLERVRKLESVAEKSKAWLAFAKQEKEWSVYRDETEQALAALEEKP